MRTPSKRRPAKSKAKRGRLVVTRNDDYRLRYTVERCSAGLGNFRRLLIRWERLVHLHLSFFAFAVMLRGLEGPGPSRPRRPLRPLEHGTYASYSAHASACSCVQGGQHLVDEQVEAACLREIDAVELEVPHTQGDEGTHLLDYLLRGAHEAEVLGVTIGVEAVSGEGF